MLNCICWPQKWHGLDCLTDLICWTQGVDCGVNSSVSRSVGMTRILLFTADDSIRELLSVQPLILYRQCSFHDGILQGRPVNYSNSCGPLDRGPRASHHSRPRPRIHLITMNAVVATVQDLLSNSKHTIWIAPLIILGEAMLCGLIIWKVSCMLPPCSSPPQVQSIRPSF